MNDFFNTVRSYLLEYLPKQRCYSQNTIIAYRQTLNLFVTYLRDEKKFTVEQIEFKVLNRDMILDFLNWLESKRNCGVSTRNHRLMVLRSFFNYAGEVDCTQMALSLKTQNIPIKSGQSKVVDFLSESALQALLKQPNPNKNTDLRNLFFMILMYDTAARCGEMLNMQICDLRINSQKPIAYLHGKGNKTRVVPLLPKTIKHYEKYMKVFHPNESADSTKNIFYTIIHGMQQPMSSDTVARFLQKYADAARLVCQEVPNHVHPHMIRHTRAMHLYRQGMPMMLLSEFLGHASIETTKIYAYADTEMKRAAIEKANTSCTTAIDDILTEINDEEMILKLSGLL